LQIQNQTTMKIFHLVQLLFLLFFLTVGQAFAQDYFVFHAGLSSPVSNFASEDINNSKAAGAGLGLNMGLQYNNGPSKSGLGVFFGIELNYNGLKAEIKDDFEDDLKMEMLALGLTDVDISFYKYINVPVTIGLKYKVALDQGIAAFGNAGLALNFLKVTDMDVVAADVLVTTTFEMGIGIGYKVGGGFIINDKISLACNYFSIGDMDVNTKTYTVGYSQQAGGRISVDMLTFAIGYKF
jgi:hypothetical protein